MGKERWSLNLVTEMQKVYNSRGKQESTMINLVTEMQKAYNSHGKQESTMINLRIQGFSNIFK